MFTATEVRGMIMSGVNRNIKASFGGRVATPSRIASRKAVEKPVMIAAKTRFFVISIIILENGLKHKRSEQEKLHYRP